jgi:hypothetical protein
VRRRGGFLRKAVVYPEGTPDYEQAVGDIVSGAESEFLDVGVDEEWANFQGERQGERLVFSCTGFGNPLDCGPFTESDDVRLGRGGCACLSEDEERQSYPKFCDAGHGRG